MGDNVKVKGPFSKLPYTPNMKRHIGMIAGGSGITPMLQVLQQILSNPADTTEVSLVYANHSEDDIILKVPYARVTSDTHRVTWFNRIGWTSSP